MQIRVIPLAAVLCAACCSIPDEGLCGVPNKVFSAIRNCVKCGGDLRRSCVSSASH